MPVAVALVSAPTPSEIFKRAAREGERRLDQSMLELLSTSFIAGFTIVFGIVGLAIAHAAVEPLFGGMARLAGGLAFAIGLVMLIVGRAELFTENFFDPAAKVFENPPPDIFRKILRLWGVTFVLNLVGGGLLVLVVSVDGVLSTAAGDVLAKLAEEIAARGAWASFAAAVLGGALVTMLSFLLQGTNSVLGRITMAYLVGFLLTLGVFDHVIVTLLLVFAGMLFDAHVGYAELATIGLIAALGNLVGGVGLVTMSHVAQAKGGED